MRLLAILLTGGLLIACGGISGSALDDGGTGDEKSPSIDCNGTSCSAYCIHPSATTCAVCALAPDAGTCPAGSTFQKYCPAGPAMPGDGFCVTYPTPEPDHCSTSIPPSCFVDPPPAPANITCMPTGCAS